MKCGKCGREIADTAKFCPYCGTKRMVPAGKTTVFKDQEELSETEKQQMVDAAKKHAAENIDRETQSGKKVKIVVVVLLLLGAVAIMFGIRHFQLHSYTSAGIRNVEQSIDNISCEDDYWDTKFLIQDVYKKHREELTSAQIKALQALRVVIDDDTYQYSDRDYPGEMAYLLTNALEMPGREDQLCDLGLKYKIYRENLIACTEDFSYYSNKVTLDGDDAPEKLVNLGYWDIRQQKGESPKQYWKTLSGGYLFVDTDYANGKWISTLSFWTPDTTYIELDQVDGEFFIISLQSWGASSTGQLLYYLKQNSGEKAGQLCTAFLDGSQVGQKEMIAANADINCRAAFVGSKLYFAAFDGDSSDAFLSSYDPLDRVTRRISGKTEYVYDIGGSQETAYWEKLPIRQICAAENGSSLFVRFAGLEDDAGFDWLTIYDPSAEKDVMPCKLSMISATIDSESRDLWKSLHTSSLTDYFDGERLYHFHMDEKAGENQTYRLCTVSENDRTCHTVIDNIPADSNTFKEYDGDGSLYFTTDWDTGNQLIKKDVLDDGFRILNIANQTYQFINEKDAADLANSGQGLLPFDNGKMIYFDWENGKILSYGFQGEEPAKEILWSLNEKESGPYNHYLVDWYSDPFGMAFLFTDGSEVNVIYKKY